MKLYDSLQNSPIFQGLTSDNLLQIIGQTKFTSRKIAAGDTIKDEGEKCNRLALVTSGQAKSIAHADDRSYTFEENVAAPYMLQPECVFGLHTHYTRTFIATKTCDTVEIDKNDLMRISDEFIIFRMNLINYQDDTTGTRDGNGQTCRVGSTQCNARRKPANIQPRDN